ncbi:MAG TPA: serine/threonine-protein kinase [Polyangia bacterium]|nr:serine/threonine-protein kinase [Polyangia bacterium]
MLAPALPIEPGAVLGGSYRADRRIASGGIGEVWAGVDMRSRRAVAIKRLLPRAASTPAIAARFEREAEVLARIYSDFVVRRVDFMTDRRYGRLLVEELVDGETLARLLVQRRLTVEQARDLGFNLLRALVALERAGVVHGDLKPANVILKPLGGGHKRPILIDFGSARLIGSAQRPHSCADDYVVVTFAYMAPEQLSAASFGHAADLYAVGGILYRAVAGHRPFANVWGPELLQIKHSCEVPRLCSGRSDWMAERLERVVARALRRNPAERYQRADDMLTDLMALPQASCGRRASAA